MSMADIIYINSISAVFRNGILRFDPEVETEVYDQLKIRNADQLLTNAEIDEILLNPTLEGLQRIINITDSGAYERVRGRCTMLQNAGSDISTRVKKVVDRRYEELRAKRVKTDIVLTPKTTATATTQPDEKVAALEEQLAAQSAQINQLLAMMSQFASAEKVEVTEAVADETEQKTQKKSTKSGSKNAKAKTSETDATEEKAD
jgi:hypothetical protein